MNALKPLITPTFYKSAVSSYLTTLRPQIQSGSFSPLISLMVFTGVVGYGVEWGVIGRFHVRHEKERVRKAIEEYEGRHGKGH